MWRGARGSAHLTTSSRSAYSRSLLRPWLSKRRHAVRPSSTQSARLTESWATKAAAELNYHKALELDRNYWRAHVGLATAGRPGDLYYVWLERFYQHLSPTVVLEIGVADGASLALVKPPTIAIGVDPMPAISRVLQAETHIFAETSDAFFTRGAAEPLLAGRDVGVGFIDGLHLYSKH